jgi:Transposase IS66 family/Family of unknown function (DUF6444)
MDRVEAEAIYDSGREACVQFILDLASRVAQLDQRLERLEAQARQDSRTSSKPPSTDPPKTRAQRRAEARAKAKELMRGERERRAQGGQPGHQGAGRDLGPEDQVDEIVDHYPDACGGCERRFDDEQRRPGGRFGRHQVCELPPISVTWTEHRTHQLRCRHCRARTSARLPALVACAPFGLRLQAAVVTLTARYRISRRGICELASDLFGVTLSAGAVDAICQRASDALAGPHCQLQDWVLDQDAVHVDETGWRTRGEGRALWTAMAREATFLQIAQHCNREQFNALIGTSYPGILVSDRWNGYSTSTRTSGRCAGRICSATSAATATAWESRRPSASKASSSPVGCSPPGAHTSTSITTARRSRPRSNQSARAARATRAGVCEEGAQSLAPAVRQQPAQGLARALDLHHHRRGRADQQPRRARTPRPGHPPQSLARHPKQAR